MDLSNLASLGVPTSYSPAPRTHLNLSAGDVGHEKQVMMTGGGGGVGRGDISVDSAYFTSPESVSSLPATPPLPPNAVCPTKTRSSTWMASLKQILHQPAQQTCACAAMEDPSTSLATVILPESLVGCTATVPETEEELDLFLFQVWTKDTVTNPRSTTSAVSHYVRKVSELRQFYEHKMAEVDQREAAYLSELIHYDQTVLSLFIQPEQLLSLADSRRLQQVLLEAKVNYRFNQIRYKLKREAAETVAKLRAQYIADNGRKKKVLPHRTTKLLNEWFEKHLDHPYPTIEEKRELSVRGDITVEQVTRWFANKRSRNKAMRGIPTSKGH